jgi:hypothetical protein|tara:strand:+ start:2336 stop:2719 length:384 start_codon:yes stop_codon:yes gene_type:complete
MEKTMTDEEFYYSKEILRQINAADPNAMNCWGVMVGHNCFALPESETRRAGIKMMTNGFIHKGRVDVDLTWADDYTLKFYNRQGEVLYKIERVYAPELCRQLDVAIESGKDSPVKDLEMTSTVTRIN